MNINLIPPLEGKQNVLQNINKTNRIGFCGTQNSGKTTLVKALSKLPEFQNHKIFTEKSKEIRDIGIPLNTDSTLKGQSVFLAHRCVELMENNFISDRSLIDVMSYCKAAPSINYYEKEAFCNLASMYLPEYDYIFYVSPEGVEIENNGVRETNAEYRDLIDFTINNVIRHYRYKIKNFYRIKGSTDERIQQIKEAMNL